LEEKVARATLRLKLHRASHGEKRGWFGEMGCIFKGGRGGRQVLKISSTLSPQEERPGP